MTDRTSTRERPSRRRSLVKRGATALAAASAAVVLASAPAQAWPGSSRVDLAGFASCSTRVTWAQAINAQSVWTYVERTGETALVSVNWAQYFEAHLTSIPAGGSWVQVWTYCAVPGFASEWRYAAQVYVSRPLIGTYDGPYWVRGQ